MFLALTGAAATADGFPGVTATRAELLTAELPVAEARELRHRADVASVELGQPLSTPAPAVADGDPPAPDEALRRFGSAEQHRFGHGVLIGLIDVGGFDFAHEDFLDADGGDTRFVRIWDQGGDTRPSPAGVRLRRRAAPGAPRPRDRRRARGRPARHRARAPVADVRRRARHPRRQHRRRQPRRLPRGAGSPAC